jgi:AraC-like DNA-binding protein
MADVRSVFVPVAALPAHCDVESLPRFILNLRLDRARGLLLSNRESRAQGDLALALGFSSGPAFARQYLKRFGESVSATRRRAAECGGSLKQCDQRNFVFAEKRF